MVGIMDTISVISNRHSSIYKTEDSPCKQSKLSTAALAPLSVDSG